MRLLQIAAVCGALVLAACGGEPAETAMTPELLENPAEVQKVANRLEPADREAFSRYVAGRTMATAMGGKPLVNSSGKDPATVQEAIALQTWADGLEQEREAAQAPHEAVIMAGGEGVSTAKYNAAVAGYNGALAAYQQKRDAGPPQDLAASAR